MSKIRYSKSISRETKYDDRYKQWRKAVFERDGYHCQFPNCTYNNVRGLQAHHIHPWAQYPELRYEVSNGIVLCKCCHFQIKNDKFYRRMFDLIVARNESKQLKKKQTDNTDDKKS